MKIGVQMYTVRDYLKNPEEIYTSLKRIKSMGFNLVQFSGLGPCNIDLLAGWIKEFGLNVCSTHSPWERISDEKELKILIDEHKKLNCPIIGLGARPQDVYPNTYEGWTRFIKKTNEICEQAGKAGLGFGYHNHELEFMKFNEVCAIDRMIEECPKLEFTLDVFWVQAGGKNPCEYMDKLKNRIRILHLKDFRITGRNRQYAEIGMGNLDWPAIFSRCKQYNIPYAVIEQDGDFLKDPFDSLCISRKYLAENGYIKQD